MADEPENLTLRYLRSMDGKLDRINTRLGNVEQAQVSMNQHIAVLVGDMANVRERFAEVEVRLDRIEQRLSLAEA